MTDFIDKRFKFEFTNLKTGEKETVDFGDKMIVRGSTTAKALYVGRKNLKSSEVKVKRIRIN